MKKTIFTAAVALVLLTGILSAFWIGGIIMGGSGSDTLLQDEMIDYVIIPGCRLEGSEPGKCLKGRIDAAIEYLRTHSWSMAVCSGGQGSDEEISEAEAISRELIRRGIPARRILKEDNSHSTYENLIYTKELLDERKGDTPYKVVIATSEFHVYRARFLANYVGFEEPKVISVKSSADIFYPCFLREIAAVIFAWFKYR